MAQDTPISSALDEAINNLRKKVSGEPTNVDQEQTEMLPAQKLAYLNEDLVKQDVANIPFAPLSPEQERQQKMQESINKIKRQEENKLFRQETEQEGLRMGGGRGIAAQSIGPAVEKVQQQLFKPSEPSKAEAEAMKAQASAGLKKAIEEPQSNKELNQYSKVLEEAVQELKPALSQDSNTRSIIEKALAKSAEVQARQQERLEKLTDKAGKPLFEQGDTAKVAILALAPIVAGYLADGARGGAIGAQAGQIGVAKFEEQKKDQLERELKALEKSMKVDSSALFSTTKLVDALRGLDATDQKREALVLNKRVTILSKLADIHIAQMKSLDDQKKSGLLSQAQFLQARAKIQNDFTKAMLDADKIRTSLIEIQQKGEKIKKEEGSPDLGFGFVARPTVTKQDRTKAQAAISTYGDVESAFKDVIDEVRSSNLKSLTSWSDTGEELNRKAQNLKDALIAFSKRGGQITGQEVTLINGLGFSLEGEGSIKNRFKIAMNAPELANRLEAALQALKRRTAGKVKTYGVDLVEEQPEQARVAPVGRPKLTSKSEVPQGEVIRVFEGKKYRFVYDSALKKMVNQGEVK